LDDCLNNGKRWTVRRKPTILDKLSILDELNADHRSPNEKEREVQELAMPESVHFLNWELQIDSSAMAD
jgi:hypothetical protein